MIKETKTLKETTERHKYCDDCGTEIRIGLACSKAVCQYCKKDLCNKCIGHEDNSWGDYRIVYCKTCWELGNEYRPIIEQKEKEIEKMYNEWQSLCKNNLMSKTE